MFKCAGTEKDYPFRVKSPGSNIVHAAEEVKGYGYQHNKRTVHRSLCRSTTVNNYELLPPTEKITCKRCLKIMGAQEEISKDNFKYILQERESGYFFKNSGWGSDKNWIKDFRRATIYNTPETAASKGVRDFYLHNRTGEKFTPKQYQKLTAAEKRWCYHTTAIDKKRYVVRKIKLELI